MWIFDPEIALRADGSDPARNQLFRADFLNATYWVVSFSATVERLKRFIGGRGESVDYKKHRRSLSTVAGLATLAKYNIIVATFLGHSASKYAKKIR